MAYTKTNWSNDTVPAINEENLNKIENGIFDAHTKNDEQDNKINLINSYSEQENLIGDFLGKPLYRKVLVFNNFTYNTWVNYNIPNIDWIVDAKGMLYETTGNFIPLTSIYQNNEAYSGSDSRSIYKIKRNQFFISTKTNASTTDTLKLILEYTKTTN